MFTRIYNTVSRTFLWCSVVFLIGIVLGGLHESDAMVFNVGHESKHYLRILHVEDGYILVGARDALYNVSTETMQVVTKYPWMPFQEEIQYCERDSQRFGGDCSSYVRSAVKRGNSLFHVCASSSKKPQCRELRNVDSVWTLTDTQVDNELIQSLSPLLPWSEMITLQTKDTNTMYVASHILKSGSVWQPYFFRANSKDINGVEVGGLKTVFSEQLFKIDYYSERATEFTSLFETDDYVYLTYTEPAIETIYSVSSESTVYSRIARVCKNDRGRGEDKENLISRFLFATLFKTRLMCGDAGIQLTKTSGHYLERKFNGYYGSYVNEIVDSSAPHLSSVTGADGEEIILAIFNSPRNSSRTSAICAYKVSDLNRVFDTSDQIEFDNQQIPRVKKTSRPAAQCYEDSRNQTSETKPNLNNYLLSTPVYPINNHSLFLSGLDYRMTRMVVDWQVEAVDGKKYDIIFVSTDDGRLLKLVKFRKGAEAEEKYHIVEERLIFPGAAIQEMKLIVDESGKKHLLLNTLDKVKRVALEKCHMRVDCSDCIALQDPYCSWSPSHSKCVSTTHQAEDKFQNISTGQSFICQQEVTIVDEKPKVEITTTPREDLDNNAVKSLPSIDDEVVKSDMKQTNKTVLIAMVVVLPVVFAVLGFIAGWMISKRRHMSPTPHLDQELTNKCKDDSLNSDAYQALPKTSNLQMMNNLNGKLVNGDTMSGTLNRQKQVYV